MRCSPEVKNALLAGIAIGITSYGIVQYALNNYIKQHNEVIPVLHNVWPFVRSKYKHKFHVISSEKDLDAILTPFLEDVKTTRVIGIDCEWTSYGNHSNKVALLQISTHTGICLLIRLCQYKDKLTHEILDVLSSKDILKIGVGSIEDGAKLFKDHGIVVNGLLDLRSFTTRYRLSEPKGLQGLSKEFLNVSLNKSKSIRCSNWEAERLSIDQITYAAKDALSAMQIFQVLLQKVYKSNLDNNNDRGIVDVKFKQSKRLKDYNSILCNERFKCPQKVVLKDPKFYKPMKKYSTRQNPLYDNCKLEAPDGQLLSTCDRKKANWYVQKKLAEMVCEDPFTVRLFFEPAGRPDDDRDYYLYDKENKCVVCAETQYLVRKNIIPHEYRKHFPLCMKDHVSHDILLLCLNCHQQTNYNDSILRHQIAEEYSAPMGSMQTVRLLEKPERRSVRSAARAILNAGDKLPEHRKVELENLIKMYFNVEIITEKVITDASELETRVENESYIPHGTKVVTKIKSEKGVEGLLAFETRWRTHFIETMKPKHMPHLWSLDHNHEKVMKKINT